MWRELLTVVLRAMFAVCEQFEVFESVVRLIAVFMMDMAPFRNWTIRRFPDLAMQAKLGIVIAIAVLVPDPTIPFDTGVAHMDSPFEIVDSGVKPLPITQTG